MTRRTPAPVAPLAFALLACVGAAAVGASAVGAAAAPAQEVVDLARRDRELAGEGWRGFGDLAFLGRALLSLLLATALGAALAYLPRRHRTAESLEAAEIPKVLVVYAVIGAVIGIMVLEYGLVVGFVIFGIGGLTRFRSDLRSAPDTGRLILITLIGLSCGLDLPHLAALATVFGLVLLAVLEARATYHIAVKGLTRDALGRAAEAYRGALVREGCRLLSERKNFEREQVTFVFRAPRGLPRERLAHRLETGVPEAVRGTVDWEVD